jgi:phage terminase small subunit
VSRLGGVAHNCGVPTRDLLPTKTLSPREEQFVLALISEPSGTHAALAAGFSPSGSRGAASVAAHRLLQRPHVAEAVERAREARRRAFDEALAVRARGVVQRILGD